MLSKEKRQKKIQYLLFEKDTYRINELCDILKCSETTLRNDLKELESKGLVQRTYGGVIPSKDISGSHTDELKVQKKEKNAIAKYLVTQILKDNQTIILDIGTTTLTVAEHIFKSSLKLNVITNSLGAANILSKNDNINLFVPGGKYNSFLDSFDIAKTLSFYSEIYADYYLMSCNGVDLEKGFTIPFNKIISTKKILLDQSLSTIVLADSSKIGKITSKKICGLNDVDMLITDENCPEAKKVLLDKVDLKVKYSLI